MQTQRDHVHAYQFMVGRMTSALVFGDPATLDPPARRAWLGLVVGVVLAVLVTAAFGVFGIVRPGGSTAWRKPGVILLEQETGTRYVMLGGILHATPNQASAMLMQGADAKIQRISRNSLAGLPRGAPIGIAGAPDPVPRPADLLTEPPLLCLAGAGATLVASPPAESLPANEYVVLHDAAAQSYLLLRGTLYPLAEEDVATELGLEPGGEAPAPGVWLEQLPEGPVIGPASIEGRGNPGPAVDGVRHDVGQLFLRRVGGDGRQFFVLLRDGLARLSETEFTLLAGRFGNPLPISAAAVVAAPKSVDSTLAERLPDLTTVSPARLGDRSLCLRTGTTGATVPVAVSDVAARSGGGVEVDLPPSRGLLAAADPVPNGQRDATRYLITDQGVAHRIADDDSLRALGLGGATPVPVDARLLAALPVGPTLSRTALVKG